MYDTSLAIARMATSKFLDKYTNMKLIASHGGGYLPFIHGRLDVFFNVETLVKFDLPKNRPSIWSKFIMTQSSMIWARWIW